MKTKQHELFEAIQNDNSIDQIAQIINEGADVNSVFNSQIPLVQAIGKGNIELVNFLLEKGVDINSTSGMQTALIASIWSPNPAIFDLLVASGADINQQDNAGMGPLVYAINSGKNDIVKTILEHKDVNVNPITHSQTPLTAAAMSINEDTDLVKTMLKMGAEVNPVTNNQTPLTAASMMGNLATVKLLLAYKAEVNPATNNQTPLTAAAMRGDINIVKILLSAGAEVNPVGVFQTPLIAAIQSGKEEIFDLLVEHKADVNLITKNNETPLGVAIRNIKYDMATKLIHLDVDVHNTFSAQNGYNFLSNLIWNPNPELLQLVLEKGVDVNVKNPFDGKTILDTALQNGKHEMAEILKSHGAEVGGDLNYQVAEYQSPQISPLQELMQAVCQRNLDKVKKLVEQYGAELVNSSNCGNPLLFQAIIMANDANLETRVESIKILDYLLEVNGVDLNVTNNLGTSVLGFALVEHPAAADKLIEHGATRVDTDANAMLIGRHKLFDYLIGHSAKASELINKLSEVEIDKVSVTSLLKSIITDGHRATLQAVVTKGGNALFQAINDVNGFKEIKKDFMKYGIKYHAKYHTDVHDFIITSTNNRDEYSTRNDVSTTKQDSKTFFNKENKICLAKTGKVIEELNNARYVVSKTGVLYVDIDGSNRGAHSCFLKGKPGDELFGYGKPVACGGFLSIENGKIKDLNGSSGHYMPNTDQIKVVAHYFFEQGVVEKGLQLSWYDQDAATQMFGDVASMPIGDILDQYAEVSY